MQKFFFEEHCFQGAKGTIMERPIGLKVDTSGATIQKTCHLVECGVKYTQSVKEIGKAIMVWRERMQ